MHLPPNLQRRQLLVGSAAALGGAVLPADSSAADMAVFGVRETAPIIPSSQRAQHPVLARGCARRGLETRRRDRR